jgi:DNA-binding response OmpR family regulator
MIPLVKRVLVVAHNAPLRESRVLLLQSNGYYVESVGTDDEAIELLENEQFDLILIGRKSQLLIKGIDQRLREKYPTLLTLQIEALGEIESIYPSRITDAVPEHVITALKEMLTS